MTIIDKIAESVKSATGLAFYYDTPATLNKRVDNVNLPCAMMYIVESGTVTDENGIMRERLTVQVLFTNLSDLDFDGLDNERERLDEMKRAAYRWVLSLRRSDALRLVSVGDTHRYYASEDAIITAFAIQVTVDEIQGVCYDSKAINTGYSCGCAG